MKGRGILVLGDVIAISAVTLFGLGSQGELSVIFFPRFAAAFLPLSFSWLVLAPWIGLFDPAVVSRWGQLWRPTLGMIFAGPLAVLLRGLILNAPIVPIFAVVLSAGCAAGLTMWRF